MFGPSRILEFYVFYKKFADDIWKGIKEVTQKVSHWLKISAKYFGKTKFCIFFRVKFFYILILSTIFLNYFQVAFYGNKIIWRVLEYWNFNPSALK